MLPLDLPALPAIPALPALPALPDPAGIPTAAWLVVGMVAAVAGIIAVKRIRRLALFATVTLVGLLLAWNAGFLPSIS